ncbi:site-specific integrase [Sporosarcina sp. 179-K 8C2 HS]|uniref:site-specific integrase n=1 Tax=Sporosarcina sp. 179-K 8C2 HS TaxID=3142387 RepID=UPI0039A07B55
MNNLSINENSTILECYAHFNEHHNHSENTKAAYHKNIYAFQEFMEAEQVDPSVKNINFLLAKAWTTELREEGYSERTIKQRVASLKSLNSYLINLGILKANVFIEVDKGVVNSNGHH